MPAKPWGGTGGVVAPERVTGVSPGRIAQARNEVDPKPPMPRPLTRAGVERDKGIRDGASILKLTRGRSAFDLPPDPWPKTRAVVIVAASPLEAKLREPPRRAVPDPILNNDLNVAQDSNLHAFSGVPWIK